MTETLIVGAFGVAILAATAFALWRLAGKYSAQDIIAREREHLESERKLAEEEIKDFIKNLEKEGMERFQKERERLVAEVRTRKQKLLSREKQQQEKEKELSQRVLQIGQREKSIASRETSVKTKEESVAVQEGVVKSESAKVRARLERSALMSANNAKEELKREVLEDARRELADTLRRLEAETRERAVDRAREIIANALYQVAPEEAVFQAVSVVELPNDEMKGRIIGREGRNIRTFEFITGVDVLLDNTPKVVVLSCHNPKRRAVAQRALEMLVESGRISPANIEKMVAEARSEFSSYTIEAGKSLAREFQIIDFHPTILRLLGELKFHFERGYNLWSHTRELTRLAATIGKELGVDTAPIARAAILHDIGKTLPGNDSDAAIAERTKKLLAEHGETETVQNTAELFLKSLSPSERIGALPPTIAVLRAAHILSSERPGAADFAFQAHFQRMTELENLIRTIPEVSEVFAVKAGKEVRIFVDPQNVSDEKIPAITERAMRLVGEKYHHIGDIRIQVVRQLRMTKTAT